MNMFEKPLFILEMANNHSGDVKHGEKIIREMHDVCRMFSEQFNFAIKFQYRHLDTFIHPEYKTRLDLKYIKRFSETKLSPEEFLYLKDIAKQTEFYTICTPFDEKSVDLIEKQGFDGIKIASCSFTDWPLLERVVKADKPVIASVGGIELSEIDKVASFFVHRKRDFSLMHCVADYPTKQQDLQLNQIDLVKDRYPAIRVGYSTHEEPDKYVSIKLAIAKGAAVFEKHIGVPTEKNPLNAYSANPMQVERWLSAAKEAYDICGVKNSRYKFSEKEIRDLRGLRRGVFAGKEIKAGEKLDPSKIFFAIPTVENQLVANDTSKYTEFTSLVDTKPDQPLCRNDFQMNDVRENISNIVKKVRELLSQSNVVVPEKLEFDLSHHYGLENFEKCGAAIINLLNREYCKKIIALIPGQSHPEHFHKLKEETFHVLYGDMILKLEGQAKQLKKGDMIVVERGAKHGFETEMGVVFEEISSTHYFNDSYYTDNAITERKKRKTEITHWIADK